MQNDEEQKQIDEKTIVLKNSTTAKLVFIKHKDNGEWYSIDCYVPEKAEKVGFANFKLNCSLQRNRAWLYYIGVCNNDYHSIGIGSAILKAIEHFCRNMRINIIEGKFYPEGYGAENARSFYKKHGYDIIENEIFKYIHSYDNDKSDTL